MPEQGPAPTLHEVLKRHREELIARWGQRITGPGPQPGQLTPGELLDRMPFFVDEIIGALYPEALPLPPAQGNATEHGSQRFGLGFDVGEVVREYGMLHDCILELADERGAVVRLDEHMIMNRWINAGIALSLSQYVSQRELELQRQSSEHLGFTAHEVRNPLGAACLAFAHLRATVLTGGGRAVEVLERNLRRTTDVVDGALTQASLKMGVQPHLQLVHLRPFIEDLVLEAGIESDSKRIGIEVEVGWELTIDVDARLLRSAVSNLLHNAIKFSAPGHDITVRAQHHDARVTIEVHDHCGGLPPGKAEELSPLSSSATRTAPASDWAWRSPCRPPRRTTERSARATCLARAASSRSTCPPRRRPRGERRHARHLSAAGHGYRFPRQDTDTACFFTPSVRRACGRGSAARRSVSVRYAAVAGASGFG